MTINKFIFAGCSNSCLFYTDPTAAAEYYKPTVDDVAVVTITVSCLYIRLAIFSHLRREVNPFQEDMTVYEKITRVACFVIDV